MPVMTSRRKLVTTRKCRNRSKGGKRVNHSPPSCVLTFASRNCLRVVQIEVAGAEQPRQGVRAEEHKHAHQQRGHATGRSQCSSGIVLAVQRVGVGLVLGEAALAPRMALPARGQDVGLGEVGVRVGGRQHVVMAVAVVTGGHIGGDVRPAQGHRLAVIGVAIMRQAVLVALAAALVAGHLEVAVLGGLHLVRGVAVGADRAALVALGHNLSVDALAVSLLDPDVALAARLGDVRRVDRRVPVHRPLDVVEPHGEGEPPQRHLRDRLEGRERFRADDVERTRAKDKAKCFVLDTRRETDAVRGPAGGDEAAEVREHEERHQQEDGVQRLFRSPAQRDAAFGDRLRHGVSERRRFEAFSSDSGDSPPGAVGVDR